MWYQEAGINVSGIGGTPATSAMTACHSASSERPAWPLYSYGGQEEWIRDRASRTAWSLWYNSSEPKPGWGEKKRVWHGMF